MTDSNYSGFPEFDIEVNDNDIENLLHDALEGFSEEIEIQYWPNAHKLDGTLKLGGWVDLYTYEDVELRAGELQLIHLGVAMKLPEMYEAIIAPRSSTFKNWGILQANSLGIIDNQFCGPADAWMFAAYPTKTVFVPRNTRLCQFRIQPIQPPIKFKEVKKLSGPNRNGFGSSGL